MNDQQLPDAGGAELPTASIRLGYEVDNETGDVRIVKLPTLEHGTNCGHYDGEIGCTCCLLERQRIAELEGQVQKLLRELASPPAAPASEGERHIADTSKMVCPPPAPAHTYGTRGGCDCESCLRCKLVAARSESSQLRADREALSLERRVSDSEMMALLKRANKEFVDQRDDAQDALRNIACYLSVGGYNADTVDGAVFVKKIKDGIAMLTDPLEAENERLRGELAEARAENTVLKAIDLPTARNRAEQAERERDEATNLLARASAELKGELAERNELAKLADGALVATHRAFKGGSEFVQSESRRLVAEYIEATKPAAAERTRGEGVANG